MEQPRTTMDNPCMTAKSDPIPIGWPIVTGDRPLRSGVTVRNDDGVPYWWLSLTVRGGARFQTVEGDVIAVETDELLLVEPGILHHYSAADDSDWEVLWMTFERPNRWSRWMDYWPAICPGYRALSLANHPEAKAEIVGYLRDAHRYCMHGDIHDRALASTRLEAALICCDRINAHSQHRALDPRLSRAITFMRSNLSSPIRLRDIAASAGISEAHLSRLFGAGLAQSPMAHLEQLRIERAQQLLELTRMPIHMVAAEVGFPCQFHFSRRFKHVTTMSPQAYRLRLA